MLYLFTNNEFYKVHNITYKCEMSYKLGLTKEQDWADLNIFKYGLELVLRK